MADFGFGQADRQSDCCDRKGPLLIIKAISRVDITNWTIYASIKSSLMAFVEGLGMLTHQRIEAKRLTRRVEKVYG